MYHFTESTLAKHVAGAVARGVECCVILDHRAAYDTDSMCWQLAKTGVQVWTDNAHSLMHCKYAIVDGLYVLTGSANWSYNADGKAAEDFMIIGPDPELAATYAADWQIHKSHSIPVPRTPWPPSPPIVQQPVQPVSSTPEFGQQVEGRPSA
jgi:phosphatidylserine/phosphatidylglycerophosphate/cardiolipin synthase-like enzyme